MKIVNEKLLAEFRRPGSCEVCTRFCLRREPHHLLARGMGGGGRMDVRINLVSVGSTLVASDCVCHTLIHNGVIKLAELLHIVGWREKLAPEMVRERLDELRRLDRDAERPVWLK